MREFSLQPEESKLAELSEDYWSGMTDTQQDEERRAFEAGQAILNGDRSLDTLKVIVHWKSPRIVHHLASNTAEEIKIALDTAVHHSAVTEALSALQKLHGVGLPVASAILTTIYPDRYTVIDFRALESLGYFPQDDLFYLRYLDYCRTLAQKNIVPPQMSYPAPTALRALDRALWQWSAKREKTL